MKTSTNYLNRYQGALCALMLGITLLIGSTMIGGINPTKRETFRGSAYEHPHLNPSERADRVVELVEFLREKGVEPAREDFELPEGWSPPEGWHAPEGWTAPEWFPQ